MNASRREFLRGLAMTAAVAAATGTGLPSLAQAADPNRPDKWVKGVCRYCGTGCGVMVGVKDGKAVAIKGDPNNHNAGLLCLKGAMLIPVLNSKERVTQPMLRRQKEGMFAPGRFVMTCCVDDIEFCGIPCRYADSKKLESRSWVMVTAKINAEKHLLYKGETGPVLTALRVEVGADPADPDVCTF